MPIQATLKYGFLILLLLPLFSVAQTESKKRINTTDLFDLWMSKSTDMVIENADIHFNSNLLEEYITRNNINVLRDSLGRLVIPYHLTFKNCTITFYAQNLVLFSVWIQNSAIKDLWLENVESVNKSVKDVISAVHIRISESKVENIRFKGSSLSFNSDGSFYSQKVTFSNNKMIDFVSWKDELDELILENNHIDKLILKSKIQILNCIDNEVNWLLVPKDGEFGSIGINRNSINALVIEDCPIRKSLEIKNNRLMNIIIESSLEGFYFDIDWNQLNGSKIRCSGGLNNWQDYRTKYGVASRPNYILENFINPRDSVIVVNTERFYSIIELYNKLISRYREIGRLDDANGALVELEDIEGARQLALYKSTGNSKYYFNWTINRLNALTSKEMLIFGFFILIFLFGITYSAYRFYVKRTKLHGPELQSGRQLASILFTDIIGYTAMMGNNENNALIVLERNRKIQKPIIKIHKGKWLKEMGDGTLSVFFSASDAVRCAIEIMEKTKNDGSFKLRMGIHIGEIVFSDKDIFGDGVNVASRIMDSAKEGGICMSEVVYNNIKNKEDIKARMIGDIELKNVTGKMRLYKIEDVSLS